MAPPATARAPDFGIESAETPEADAERLIASFRLRAYSEARRRQRHAPAAAIAAHWGAVASLIARRTGERRGAEPPERTEPDAGGAGAAESLRAPPLVRFFEVDPLDELTRILAVRPQCFRLQFFGVDADHGPIVVTETEIQAPDASSAIRAATDAAWPARAVGLRVLDLEGREIFERLKADLR
jgi:hypothetical protein